MILRIFVRTGSCNRNAPIDHACSKVFPFGLKTGKKTLVKSMYDQYNTLSSSARNFTPYDVVCASRSSPQSLKDGAESGTSKTHRLIRAFGRVDHAHIQSHLTNKVDIGMCAKFHTD
jgi:hypothetical protein